MMAPQQVQNNGVSADDINKDNTDDMITNDDDGTRTNGSVPTGAISNDGSSSGYCIRWCRIGKSVQLKADATNSRKSSMFLDNRSSAITTGSVAAPQQAPPPSTTKDILKGISGSAMPGEILALMGPSGSGKTSLLNVLSGRSSYQSGTISINGMMVTGTTKMKRLMSQIAYVRQADIFFEHLTVRDQFTYTAMLRLPEKMPLAEKHDKVNNVIKQLRLSKVADNRISLCSGGEKKRVNIGSEILTNPSVIILDEPTSGLDSSSAVSLIRLLSTFAKDYGKTVVTSIHQPSSAVFRSFDRLLMLSEGNVVYFGSPGDSLPYLRTQNLACPDGYNAADHWMDVLVNETSIEYENAIQSNDLAASLIKSPRQLLEEAWDDNAVAEQIELHNADPMNDSVHAATKSKHKNSTNATKEPSKYNTSWATQYYILTHRAFKNSRSAIFTPLNLTKSIAIGFVSGVLWFQNEYTENNVNDIRSYYFFTMTFWVFDAMFNSLTAFPTERTVILKERSSGSYHLSAYFMAKTTADAPVRLILPLIYMIISFWMAGISNSFATFIGSIGCTLLSVLAGEAIGLLVGAAVYDLQRGITIMTVFTLFLMLLGGFFVENVPSFLLWAKYISPFKYAFDSSLQLVFDKPVPCDGSGKLKELCLGGPGTYASSRDVLDIIGVQGTVAFNVGLLLFLCFVPRYIAYWALRIKKEGER